MPALAALLLTAAMGTAQEPAAGWARQANSLLLYDSSGTLVSEMGLGTWEEPGRGGGLAVEIRGQAAPGGRFAWTLETRTSWNTGRTKRLKYERLLKYMGSAGSVLWTSASADLPRHGEPARFGAGGEIALVAVRSTGSWSAEIKSYVGNTLFSAGPFPELESIELTANGLYALARWREAEKSATHTFLNIPLKTRKDIPSSEFLLGQGRLTEEGKVYSQTKLILDLAAETPP